MFNLYEAINPLNQCRIFSLGDPDFIFVTNYSARIPRTVIFAGYPIKASNERLIDRLVPRLITHKSRNHPQSLSEQIRAYIQKTSQSDSLWRTARKKFQASESSLLANFRASAVLLDCQSRGSAHKTFPRPRSRTGRRESWIIKTRTSEIAVNYRPRNFPPISGQ